MKHVCRSTISRNIDAVRKSTWNLQSIVHAPPVGLEGQWEHCLLMFYLRLDVFVKHAGRLELNNYCCIISNTVLFYYFKYCIVLLFQILYCCIISNIVLLYYFKYCIVLLYILYTLLKELLSKSGPGNSTVDESWILKNIDKITKHAKYFVQQIFNTIR